MAVRKIRYSEDTILRKKAKKVIIIDDKIRMILDDMLDTLNATPNGAAVAANQIGILKRLVVINFDNRILKLINPEIIEEKGEQKCIEGCLSFPNVYGQTTRPDFVIVKALDEKGNEVILKEKGEMAKCLCHEIDHLNGKVFTEIIEEMYYE